MAEFLELTDAVDTMEAVLVDTNYIIAIDMMPPRPVGIGQTVGATERYGQTRIQLIAAEPVYVAETVSDVIKQLRTASF